jgi:hypothetical protein
MGKSKMKRMKVYLDFLTQESSFYSAEPTLISMTGEMSQYKGGIL